MLNTKPIASLIDNPANIDRPRDHLTPIFRAISLDLVPRSLSSHPDPFLELLRRVHIRVIDPFLIGDIAVVGPHKVFPEVESFDLFFGELAGEDVEVIARLLRKGTLGSRCWLRRGCYSDVGSLRRARWRLFCGL